MSKLELDIIRARAAAVEAPAIYAVRGSVKMWASLNGRNTIALRNSLNVSSVIDATTGSYEFNLTSAFFSQSHEANASSNTASGGEALNALVHSPESTASRIRWLGYDSNWGSLSDSTWVSISATGDLA